MMYQDLSASVENGSPCTSILTTGLETKVTVIKAFSNFELSILHLSFMLRFKLLPFIIAACVTGVLMLVL